MPLKRKFMRNDKETIPKLKELGYIIASLHTADFGYLFISGRNKVLGLFKRPTEQLQKQRGLTEIQTYELLALNGIGSLLDAKV